MYILMVGWVTARRDISCISYSKNPRVNKDMMTHPKESHWKFLGGGGGGLKSQNFRSKV